MKPRESNVIELCNFKNLIKPQTYLKNHENLSSIDIFLIKIQIVLK